MDATPTTTPSKGQKRRHRIQKKKAEAFEKGEPIFPSEAKQRQKIRKALKKMMGEKKFARVKNHPQLLPMLYKYLLQYEACMRKIDAATKTLRDP